MGIQRAARSPARVVALAALFAVGCTSPAALNGLAEPASPTDLSECERARLGAALEVAPESLSLPLDPIDEPLADIARDICALNLAGQTASASNSADSQAASTQSPLEQRNAALPADLVAAPAEFEPSDPPPGRDGELDELWVACGSGAASACNALLYESPAGSDYESYAFSCGGRENLHCNVLLGGSESDAGLLGVDFDSDSDAPGVSSELDGWWEACGAGSARACAQLALSAPGGSDYASFGWTCGGRTARDCAALLGDDGVPPALVGHSPHDPPPGDDEYLDGLWERCGALSAPACRDLATFGPPGSDYERFALSCGWRAVAACARMFAELAG